MNSVVLTKKNRIQDLFLKSWWVLFFILFCCIGYEQGLKRLHVDHRKLQNQYRELKEENKTVLEQQKRLQDELYSFSDPDWIELILMRELGLAPENQTKVFFKQ